MPTGARSEISVVCFDLGGVLVRICRSWEEACASAGIPAREVGPAFEAQRRKVAQAHQIGEIEDVHYYAEVARASDGAYSPEEVERVHHAWTLPEYPGLEALFTRLRAVPGLRLACLSNTNAAHWERLAAARESAPPEYPNVASLEVKLASHLLRLAKPDPAIYRQAQLELQSPAAGILFFDDLPPNVAAARALGWDAEAVDSVDPVADIWRQLERRGILDPG